VAIVWLEGDPGPPGASSASTPAQSSASKASKREPVDGAERFALAVPFPVPVPRAWGAACLNKKSGRKWSRRWTSTISAARTTMSRGGYLLSVAGLTVGASPPELMDTRHWLAALLSCWAFLATQGVVFYDQRNSELYDSLIRRAKHIECLLKLPRSPTAPSGTECGGQFSERPERGRHWRHRTVESGTADSSPAAEAQNH
jgi:hypothetical protein